MGTVHVGWRSTLQGLSAGQLGGGKRNGYKLLCAGVGTQLILGGSQEENSQKAKGGQSRAPGDRVLCQARQSSVGCIGKAASIHSWALGWLQAQGDPTMAPCRLPAVFLLCDGAIPGYQLPMDVWLVQWFGFGTQLRPAREGNPEQRVLRASQL